MKRVFLDTNIMMDAATMSFATMSYLLRHHGKEEIHQIFEHLTDAIEVLSVDVKQFEDAMAFGPVRDFEDMLHYQCAGSLEIKNSHVGN